MNIGEACIPWSTRRAASLAKRRGLSAVDVDRWLSVEVRQRFAHTYLRDRDGGAWTPRAYQVRSLESRAARKVHCDGRDVGKTAEIEIIVPWAQVTMPNRQMLIATQCESHLSPLMYRILRVFEENRTFAGNVVFSRRSPSWHIRFTNGFELFGRIAGVRGINFQGMHVDWQIIDEAQSLTEDAWTNLLQTLNAGGLRWVYGVPNGLRNTFYRLTRDMRHEQYHWPSSLNPGFSPEKDAELAYLYGGRCSPGYLHNVCGVHGTPEHNVFDIERFQEAVDAGLPVVSRMIQHEDEVDMDAGDFEGPFFMGADLGFAQDPTELVVYALRRGVFVNVARFTMSHVDYTTQQRVIQRLDEVFDFVSVGIDNGHSGTAVTHNLMAVSGEWADKVVAVNFGSAALFSPTEGVCFRRYTKELLTELLIRRIHDGTIAFPDIAERHEQYAEHTYHTNLQGRVVYSKGNDHIIDADRCALMALLRDVVQPVNAWMEATARPVPHNLRPRIEALPWRGLG